MFFIRVANNSAANKQSQFRPSDDKKKSLSPMHEVDRVAPVIFNMPAEGAEAHPYITPGYLHTRYITADILQH